MHHMPHVPSSPRPPARPGVVSHAERERGGVLMFGALRRAWRSALARRAPMRADMPGDAEESTMHSPSL
jgi:hypothetical protein